VSIQPMGRSVRVEHHSRTAVHSDARDRLRNGIPVAERRLNINGIDTLVLECGQGPPLILLHGGIECGGVYWAPVISQLAQSHRLIVPDVPGLGESEPVEQLDDAAFSAWFQALLPLTLREKPGLIAHSLLGSMAARFAAGHGELLERLVIYAAPGVGPYHMPLGLRLVAILFALRPSEGNMERFERWAFADFDRARHRNPEWLAAFSAYTRSRAVVPHVKRTMRQLIGNCTKPIADAELQRIEVPTTLMWGRQDRFVPLGLAEAASARLGWRLDVIEDAGHATHIEQPEAFVRALQTVLLIPPRPGTHRESLLSSSQRKETPQ
jgi:pimeloyl-ACP methyl ester carboxylesterase